ncbi:hypothetical protein EDC04DRAFT_2607232 [Pisolithus marmoratus]|nr:hypothetical protein EDC04DRAFT_2607232 [Pisolithus marmoratus]
MSFLQSEVLNSAEHTRLEKKIKAEITCHSLLADWGYAVPIQKCGADESPIESSHSGLNGSPRLYVRSPGGSKMKMKPQNLLEGKDSIVIPIVSESILDSSNTPIDASPLHHTGTWAWMATELSHTVPGIPVVHQPHHDLESFFYILIAICLLYDTPSATKSPKMLAKCFDPLFTMSKPSITKTLAIQSKFGWSALVLPYISSYFQPLIPLLEELQQELILPIKLQALLSTDTLSHHSPLRMTGTSSGSAGVKHRLDSGDSVSNSRGKKHAQPNSWPSDVCGLGTPDDLHVSKPPKSHISPSPEYTLPFCPSRWLPSTESSTTMTVMVVTHPPRDLAKYQTKWKHSQGKQINPMAPSFQVAGEQNSHHQQINSIPPDISPSQTYVPPRSPQLVFSLAPASQQFGFRLPDNILPQTGTEINTQALLHAWFGDFDEQNNSPQTVHTTRLECTASFYHLPLSLDQNGHSITTAPRVHADMDEPQMTYPHDKIDEASLSEDESTHSITEARCVTPFLPGPILHPTLGNNELARASYKLPVGGIDNVMSLGHVGTQLQQDCHGQAPTQSHQATVAQEAENILAVHHKCNCPPQLPSSNRVAAKPQEVLLATKTADHGHGDTDATKPASPATEGAEPWQLQYYDPSAHDIIDRAKQFSHCDAPSTTLRKQSLSIEHDTSTFQRVGGHIMQQESPGYLFLKDGIDDEGHANNLAHLALAGLIINSFYTGSTLLGQLFPGVFSPEVPRVTTAITATALKVALDEIVSGVGEVNFRVAIYSPVYVEILGLMSKCDTSPIHWAKT